MKDYEESFEEFWRELVCNEDGTLNVDQVKRELHDYRLALRNVPLVYDHVTGGQASKPNTLAQYVIDSAEEHYERMYADD